MTNRELLQHLNPLTDFVNTTLVLLKNLEDANPGDETIEYGIDLLKEGQFEKNLKVL